MKFKTDYPPQKENGNEIVDNTINELARFDTEGFEEYNSKGFNKYVIDKKINVNLALDKFLDSLNLSERFSIEEMEYIKAFRAWLHCDFNNAKKYVDAKFDFRCNSNEDFLKKYQFFNTIAAFIFENGSIAFKSDIILREEHVFNNLKEKASIGQGSFLLNYLSQDYISVIDKTEFSVEKEKDIDWVPYEIAPRIYAFDTKNSVFSFINNTRELEKNTLYLSDEKDYEVITRILGKISNPMNIDKEIINELQEKFLPLKNDIFNLGSKNKNINEKEMYLFRELHKKYHRSKIKKQTGIDISKIPLTEQRYFIDYLKFVDKESLNKVKDFNKKYRNNGIRTFLSIEPGGREMGDKILVLGEKLSEDVARKVFKKYGEIIDNVSKITEFMKSNFTKEINTSPELVNKIEETLFIKGKQLLSQTYEDIKINKEIDFRDIEKQLDRINVNTLTTFAIFKQAVKNGEKLPIESIEGSVFSKKEATEITNEQQNEMIELYDLNWKNHPDREFVESLKNYFKTSFIPESNKQKNYIYTFEKDQKIRAFVRFEKKDDASLYASALNVDEASKNFGLGEAMMDEALSREATEHILHATCRKDNGSNMRYFEKGFISRGFKKTHETEEFDLIWDENKNKNIVAKQKSQEELIDIYNNGVNDQKVEIKKSKDLISLHNNIPEGKSLVRCFPNKGDWYAVYEKVSDDYGVNLGESK